MSERKEKVERRVATEAARYVEHVWPKLEKKGGIPDTPMNRKERGQSTPAIGDRGLDIIDANRTASRYLYYYIDYFETAKTGAKAKNGIRFSLVLGAVRYDPGFITNWRAKKTADDKRMFQAFQELMRQIARGVLFTYGEGPIERAMDLEEDDPERFHVHVHAKDEQQPDWQTAHNRDNNEKTSRDAHDSYRRIYPKWKLFRQGLRDSGEEVTERAAKGMFCDWYAKEHGWEMSPRTLERAIAYVEKGDFDSELKRGA